MISKIEDIDFSFRKPISPVKRRSQSIASSTFPSSVLNLNNTSRFQEKKVLKKLKENQLMNRIQLTLKKFNDNDKILKQILKFKPVQSKKNKKQKEN